MMKKAGPCIIIVFIIVLVLIISKWIPNTIADYSIMTKIVDSFEVLKVNFQETDVLIPKYSSQFDNPYLLITTEEISLNRSKQKGAWDGYTVVITPTKLSNSNFFEITISASSTDQILDRELQWVFSDFTNDFLEREGYPKGQYTNVIGEFQQGKTIYRVGGFVYDIFDEEKEKDALAELMYIVNSIK